MPKTIKKSIILLLITFFVFSFSGCEDWFFPNSDFPPDVPLNIPFYPQECYYWCSHACIQMWAVYSEKIFYNDQWIDQYMIAADPTVSYNNDCVGLPFFKIEVGVNKYTNQTACSAHSPETDGHFQDIHIGMTMDSMSYGFPSILVTQRTHAVITRNFDVHINESFDPTAEFYYIVCPINGDQDFSFSRFKDEIFIGSWQVIDEYDLFAGYCTYGLFYTVGMGGRVPSSERVVETYQQYLKNCGTYYGGPLIYIPFGSTFLRIRSPNSTAVQVSGDVHSIKWESNNLSGNIKLELEKDGVIVGLIADNIPIQQGQYDWVVGTIENSSVQLGDLYKVRVSLPGTVQTDVSNVPFKIAPEPSVIEVTNPNGGETWIEGQQRNITWTSSPSIEHVKIEFSIFGGGVYETITESLSNSGSFSWTVPPEASQLCTVRVSDATNSATNDVSNNRFTIIANTLTLTSPSTGELLNTGTSHSINWDSTGNVGPVTLEYSIDGGENFIPIVESVENSGSHLWIVPEIPSPDCIIKIYEAGDGEPNDESPFSIIEPKITVAGKSQSFVTGTVGSDIDFIVAQLDLNGNLLWQRNFGGVEKDRALSICETGDRHIAISGSNRSYTLGADDLLVYKIDKFGNEIWFKNFGGTEMDQGNGITATSDNGFVLVGQTSSFVTGTPGLDSDIVVYKIDTNGTKLWRKNLGDIEMDTGFSVSKTIDGGFVVAGCTQSSVTGTPGQDTDIIVYKLSSTGSVEWSNHFGGTALDIAYSIIETSDNSFILTGETDSFVTGVEGEDKDIVVFKINNSGEKIWRKNFGGPELDRAYTIRQTSDNGFILVGETRSFVTGTTGVDSDIVVYKLDPDGNKMWRKNFGGVEPEIGYDIQQTFDDGFVLTGSSKSFVNGTIGEDRDIIVYRLTADGTKLWRKNIGGIYDEISYGLIYTLY